VKRGILIVVALLAGCTAEAPPPPAGAPVVMGHHRTILPDGNWPVLITNTDPAAATLSFDLITLSGPPEFRITNDDPAVRTMTVVPAASNGPYGWGPYLLTVRRGRITGVHAIAHR
jgi:hypothetical protein